MDDYTQIKFPDNRAKADIKGRDLREAIKILLKNEVLRPDGTLDETKIEMFIKNYDEKITDRTILQGIIFWRHHPVANGSCPHQPLLSDSAILSLQLCIIYMFSPDLVGQRT